MTHNPLPPPADACAPDTDRAGPDAPARLPEWLVHLIALVIRFILQRSFAESSRHAWLPSWCNYRLDLAVRLGAATRRVETWRVRQRHRLSVPPPRHRPSHPEWPSLSRAIVAFGGSIKGFRRGLPACGLQWWENPDIVPGMLGATACPPAADAMALLLSRQTVADTSPPIAQVVPTDAAMPPPSVIRRQVYPRAGLRLKNNSSWRRRIGRFMCRTAYSD